MLPTRTNGMPNPGGDGESMSTGMILLVKILGH